MPQQTSTYRGCTPFSWLFFVLFSYISVGQPTGPIAHPLTHSPYFFLSVHFWLMLVMGATELAAMFSYINVHGHRDVGRGAGGGLPRVPSLRWQKGTLHGHTCQPGHFHEETLLLVLEKQAGDPWIGGFLKWQLLRWGAGGSQNSFPNFRVCLVYFWNKICSLVLGLQYNIS